MFYYLKGNHDVSTFFDEAEDMPDNLKTFGDEWITYCPGEDEKCSIRITGAELSAANSTSLYDSLVLDTACINIVMMHGQESESYSDRTECINLRALKNKGIDYLALGHIHSYKKERLDARGVYCYPGCLEGRGFDECGEHGFVLLDIDEAKRVTDTEFVPLAFRKFHCAETDISGCMTTPQIEDRILKKLSEEKYDENDLIKIVLTGSVDVECEKDVDYLSKKLEGRYYYLKIDDKSHYKADLSLYKHDESLKGEFVRTVMADETVSEADKAAIIRYGIQALKGRAD
jgi:DNA repair exonuclease SbcCD nuclease subunit